MPQRAGGSAAIPTMRLPLNAAMPTLPSTPFPPDQCGTVAMPALPLPPCPKSKVVMQQCPPCHYHLLVKQSKVVMPPCPHCHYHLAFKCKGVTQPSPHGHYQLAFKSKVVMKQSPPDHYHPARKSKVVMQPFPPGHYHFALESMFGRGGKTSTEIGPGITSGVIPRVSPNSSLPLSPRCPQN